MNNYKVLLKTGSSVVINADVCFKCGNFIAFFNQPKEGQPLFDKLSFKLDYDLVDKLHAIALIDSDEIVGIINPESINHTVF